MDSDQPDFTVNAADEAWFLGQLELVKRLAANIEPADAPEPPKNAPIVFLDLDDVLCLNDPVGAFDALECVQGKRDGEFVYKRLLTQSAVEALRLVHTEMNGHIRYVISSAWRLHFTRAQLRYVLKRAGLGFVSDSIEPGAAWSTPSRGDRREQIFWWREANYSGEAYVVIDDTQSGTGLAYSPAFRSRVVLCQENVGLLAEHVAFIVRALKVRPYQAEGW